MASQGSEDWNGMSQGTATKADFYLAVQHHAPDRPGFAACGEP